MQERFLPNIYIYIYAHQAPVLQNGFASPGAFTGYVHFKGGRRLGAEGASKVRTAMIVNASGIEDLCKTERCL